MSIFQCAHVRFRIVSLVVITVIVNSVKQIFILYDRGVRSSSYNRILEKSTFASLKFSFSDKYVLSIDPRESDRYPIGFSFLEIILQITISTIYPDERRIKMHVDNYSSHGLHKQPLNTKANGFF